MLVVTCRVASVALILALVPLWAPGTGSEVQRYSTGINLRTGGEFCKWSSDSTRNLGLLRYYEVSTTQREGAPTVERSAIHGWRLAATILLTVTSLGVALRLWRVARRVRTMNLPNQPLQPTSGGRALRADAVAWGAPLAAERQVVRPNSGEGVPKRVYTDAYASVRFWGEALDPLEVTAALQHCKGKIMHHRIGQSLIESQLQRHPDF